MTVHRGRRVVRARPDQRGHRGLKVDRENPGLQGHRETLDLPGHKALKVAGERLEWTGKMVRAAPLRRVATATQLPALGVTRLPYVMGKMARRDYRVRKADEGLMIRRAA